MSKSSAFGNSVTESIEASFLTCSKAATVGKLATKEIEVVDENGAPQSLNMQSLVAVANIPLAGINALANVAITGGTGGGALTLDSVGNVSVGADPTVIIKGVNGKDLVSIHKVQDQNGDPLWVDRYVEVENLRNVALPSATGDLVSSTSGVKKTITLSRDSTADDGAQWSHKNINLRNLKDVTPSTNDDGGVLNYDETTDDKMLVLHNQRIALDNEDGITSGTDTWCYKKINLKNIVDVDETSVYKASDGAVDLPDKDITESILLQYDETEGKWEKRKIKNEKLGDLPTYLDPVPSNSSLICKPNLLSVIGSHSNYLETLPTTITSSMSAFSRDGYYPLYIASTQILTQLQAFASTLKAEILQAVIDNGGDANTNVFDMKGYSTSLSFLENGFQIIEIGPEDESTLSGASAYIQKAWSYVTQYEIDNNKPSGMNLYWLRYDGGHGDGDHTIYDNVTLDMDRLNVLGTLDLKGSSNLIYDGASSTYKYDKSITSEIASLSSLVTLIQTETGVGSSGGSGGSITAKLSALGDVPALSDNDLLSRTLVQMMGEPATHLSGGSENRTILGNIGKLGELHTTMNTRYVSLESQKTSLVTAINNLHEAMYPVSIPTSTIPTTCLGVEVSVTLDITGILWVGSTVLITIGEGIKKVVRAVSFEELSQEAGQQSHTIKFTILFDQNTNSPQAYATNNLDELTVDTLKEALTDIGNTKYNDLLISVSYNSTVTEIKPHIMLSQLLSVMNHLPGTFTNNNDTITRIAPSEYFAALGDTIKAKTQLSDVPLADTIVALHKQVNPPTYYRTLLVITLQGISLTYDTALIGNAILPLTSADNIEFLRATENSWENNTELEFNLLYLEEPSSSDLSVNTGSVNASTLFNALSTTSQSHLGVLSTDVYSTVHEDPPALNTVDTVLTTLDNLPGTDLAADPPVRVTASDFFNAVGDITTTLGGATVSQYITNLTTQISSAAAAGTPLFQHKLASFVYITATGEINHSGNLKNDALVAPGLCVSEPTTRVVYRSGIPSDYTNTVNGVRFIKGNMVVDGAQTGLQGPEGVPKFLSIPNIPVKNYKSRGFTVCSYMTNFAYLNPNSAQNVNNFGGLFYFLRENPVEWVKVRCIGLEGQYEIKSYLGSDDGSYTIGNHKHNSDPRWDWESTDIWRYHPVNDLNLYTGYDPPNGHGILHENQQKMLFVAHVFSPGADGTEDLWGERTASDNWTYRLVYKFEDQTEMNVTQAYELSENTSGFDGKAVKRWHSGKAWVSFGDDKQGGVDMDDTIDMSLDTFESGPASGAYKINHAGFQGAHCDSGPAMVFDYALTYEELRQVSRLTPGEAIAAYGNV